MSNPILDLDQRTQTLLQSWDCYSNAPSSDHFVEFVITLSSLSEFLSARSLGGFLRQSQLIEQEALPLFGEGSHPIDDEEQATIDQSVRQLVDDIQHFLNEQDLSQPERRSLTVSPVIPDLPAPRDILLISSRNQHWQDLLVQLGYFGLSISRYSWNTSIADIRGNPLLLLDLGDLDFALWPEYIKNLRHQFKSSQLIGLAASPGFEFLLTALRSGCDSCLLNNASLQMVVAQVLEMNDSQEQETFSVLIVEDSITAVKLIERALAEQKIRTRAITNPQNILAVLDEFNPDLILMDMYMPNCTGVEVARVVRQHSQYLSIPIVYLSGETDIALQVEALRLGGDHFLTKPFNPIFLNAIVKSKIERYRALRRSMYHDSLTGLLNHTSSKQALQQTLQQADRNNASLAVIMLDIDYFKKVNDTYGHPVGDQIIRSLAWLLKQRLRKTDIVGRYGGEEFLVVLQNVTREQAMAIMDKIRQDFHEIRHPYQDNYFNISFSGGIASYPALENTEALINAADAALYKSKHAGRNQLSYADIESNR